jgi:site-specific DNA-methyltransferase (adenine-specific)/adenine-specific DNA-methyltransferase
MPKLDWIGKKAVVNHHREVPFHLLGSNDVLSVGDPGSGNLLVQGDNLVALKALLPYYAGQVKCIYIDPPYNTGNEGWVYNDNVNSPEMREWLGRAVGKEAEDLSRHDKWLCMMYPRLALLKEFLHEDGSIWISIDDSEVASLRHLMDEIFGRQRFIACNIWQKRYSRENREAIGDVHEYLLLYAMNPVRFKEKRNLVPLTEQQAKVYKNPNHDPKGRWRAIPMTAQGYRPNQMYEIVTPEGTVHLPPEGRCWSTIESEFKKLLDQGRIYFGKDGKSQPNIIRYLSEVDGFVPWTWWPHEEVGHTDEARKEIRALLDTQTAFDTPKPTRLIQRILQIATDKDALVLDSFAGSGTTGQAVLAMNKADGGNRRFILVEMDKEISQNATALRLTRVVKGYKEFHPLGGGFRFCELGEPLFDERGNIRATVRFADLARHVYFTETGEPLPAMATLDSPQLGIHNGTAVYLLYNGILKDKTIKGGNVLTTAILAQLPHHDGPKVIYGTACRIDQERLRREGIVFKQLPYKLKVGVA